MLGELGLLNRSIGPLTLSPAFDLTPIGVQNMMAHPTCGKYFDANGANFDSPNLGQFITSPLALY